ncbi:MAG: right-handed parallel beta-helix repeat-containing protein, partial [Acidobacteria bacterium]|nr:right-handed parallel beta-helix repeat-containing protein [Acidobacteriota bacterium]MBI3425845.1 right-handed parallel beta-helix repeat-containing protein [Acidobacteriota bacterium]
MKPNDAGKAIHPNHTTRRWRHGLAASAILFAAIFNLSQARHVTASSATPQMNKTAGATITVTSTSDAFAPDGVCTLREAITAANSNIQVDVCAAGQPGLDTIVFNITGTGVQTIHPTSSLPYITEPVLLDGYSQPGASVNTLPAGDNAVLKIEIEGSNAGAQATCIVLQDGSDGSTVRGLALNRFGNAAAINLQNTSNNLVEGNFIGLDASGTAALPNQYGIFIDVFNGVTANNLIGGAAPAARNVIAGNFNRGVFLGAVTATTIEGNFIGTNAAGVQALPNFAAGVSVSSGSGNIIRGNVIAGNNGAGVVLGNGSGANNQVSGNAIGVNAAGNPLGNSGPGVWIYDGLFAGDTNNLIGGTAAGAGNRIANNGGDGVRITNSHGFAETGHAILGNAIYNNGGLGIDLKDDGVTANDNGDADAGPNNLQNFPVLASVSATGDIQGSLDSLAANTTYPVRIEFFANTTCNASGNGEVYLGFINVNAPSNFTASVTPVMGKSFVAATATDANGNTSEFSACQQIAGNCPVITVDPASLPVAVAGVTFNQTLTQTGGTGAIAWSVSAGVLPAGWTLNAGTGQ